MAERLPTINIVDIDGTVAAHPNRGHHDYAKVGEDLPIHKIISLVNTLDMDVDYTMFVSGRPYSCHEDTEQWLRTHVRAFDPAYGSRLFMRATGDYRKDDIVKQEIYFREIHNIYTVNYVIDDRNRVVKMWRELGLTVLQVADGDF